MARFRASFGRILTLGGLAAASGSVVAYHTLISEKAQASGVLLENSADEQIANKKTQWDTDWDKRNFRDLKNRIIAKNLSVPKEKEPEEKPAVVKSTNNENNIEKMKSAPKATRHLILVRHGQYNHGKTDEERTLTDLGR